MKPNHRFLFTEIEKLEFLIKILQFQFRAITSKTQSIRAINLKQKL